MAGKCHAATATDCQSRCDRCHCFPNTVSADRFADAAGLGVIEDAREAPGLSRDESARARAADERS